jgi:hypothetical protein
MMNGSAVSLPMMAFPCPVAGMRFGDASFGVQQTYATLAAGPTGGYVEQEANKTQEESMPTYNGFIHFKSPAGDDEEAARINARPRSNSH